MFDPNAYGDEIAGILALDGNGERLVPLAGGTCSSVEARRLLRAARLRPAVLAGMYLYFSCWEEAHRVAQDLDTPEGSYWHALVHRQEPDAGNSGYWFRRVGKHPIFPALLADANGNRYTPSFTFKKRRRYRYYVSQLSVKNPATKFTGPIRLPAREIENRVTEKLLSFLKSDAEVFDRLGAAAETPATSGQLVVAARKLALRWPALRSEQLRDLLAS